MDTLTKIQSIVANHVGAPPASIQLQSDMVNVAGWDSMRHLMIILDIEQTFGLKFGLEQVAELNSVSKLVAAVEGNAAQ